MHEETEIHTLMPNYPVPNFESAKQRILVLESLCIKSKTSEDLVKLDLQKAHAALTKVEEKEKQRVDHVTALENKIIDKNHAIQDLKHNLAKALREKTEVCETIKELKSQHDLESEINLIESKRKEQSITFATEKLNHCEKRLHYLETAYEKLFDKMMQLYELSQNEQTEKFDIAEFIIELRAEILSLKQKVSDAHERESLFKDAYERSVSDLLQYRNQNENNSEMRLKFDTNSQDNFEDPDEINYDDSNNNETPEILDPEKKTDKIIVNEFLNKQNVADKISHSENDQPLIDFFKNDLIEGSEKRRPRSAARLIDLMGDQAVPVIVKSASVTKAPYIKAALITELAKIRSFESTPLISAVLYFMDDKDCSVRNAAIDAFSQFAPISQKEHLPIIQKAIVDESPVIRRKALVLAATAKEIDSGVICKQLLQDPDHHIRRLAAASFNSTKNPETVMALFDVVKDENDEVSSTAANTLHQIFGDALKSFSQMKYKNRVALVNNFTTYITVRFDTFFPNGKLLSPLQYSLLFPSEMYIHQDESSQFKEKSYRSLNSSDSKKGVLTDVEVTSEDEKTGNNTALFDKINSCIQSSLMGCTIEEIEHELSIGYHILEQNIDQYIRDGKIIQRGKKLFLP